MQITPTALTPPPAPGGPASAGASAEPGAFAKMLSAHKPAAPTAPAKPPRARTEPATPQPEADRDASASQQPASAVPSRPVDTDTLLAPGDPQADRQDAEADSDVLAVAADMLAALNLPATTPTSPAVPPSTGLQTPVVDEPPPADALSATGATPAVAGSPAPGRTRAAAIADAAQPGGDDKQAASPIAAAESVQRASEQTPAVRAEPAQPQPIELPRGVELPQASSAIASAQRPDTGFSTPPVALAMATPPSAPEFREALGVQVSVLARDGVQHAELHLNPADMGPISVQIALVGTQAQVDFGAESPATRQIIESGLPELASALRDAGFTLAGGGVSQHPRGRSGGADGDTARPGSRRGTDGDAADAVVQRITARLPQGAIDLYA